ncbi:MAG: hypothetical protein JJU02_06985 [Cryomorphaceae bacterium]|nr:hypothetical protein [Cryomorphaceae bacterium]
MSHSKLILLIVLILNLTSCGSSNPVPELISMFTDFSKEELSEIPQGSNQIILTKKGVNPKELYNIILDELVEKEYRVVVALEGKHILGTDFDGKKKRNIKNLMHRFDVYISETDLGSEAVFKGEHKSRGSFGESNKLGAISWNIHTEPSFYFAILLDFARSIPDGEVSFQEEY